MKEKITGAERISDALIGVEEALLTEAACVDSARKMKEARRREYFARNPLGKTVAVAASILLVAGIVSAVPHLNHASHTAANSDAAVSSESSTVEPSRGETAPTGLVLNFDSMEELSAFLAAAKSEAYGDYCERSGMANLPSAEDAEKIADSVLSSDYHVGLKEGAPVDGFMALYTDDGAGVLRFSFALGRAKYVVSHFYDDASIVERSVYDVVGTFMLGGKAVSMMKAEDHFFMDESFGNTRIYVAIFADQIGDDPLSILEIIPTSESFVE